MKPEKARQEVYRAIVDIHNRTNGPTNRDDLRFKVDVADDELANALRWLARRDLIRGGGRSKAGWVPVLTTPPHCWEHGTRKIEGVCSICGR
jgi:hypothetical protein